MTEYLDLAVAALALAFGVGSALASRSKESRAEAEQRLLGLETACDARMDRHRREVDTASAETERKLGVAFGRVDKLREDFEAGRLHSVQDLAENYVRKYELERTTREWNERAVALTSQLAGLDGTLRQLQLLNERLRARLREDTNGGTRP